VEHAENCTSGFGQIASISRGENRLQTYYTKGALMNFQQTVSLVLLVVSVILVIVGWAFRRRHSGS
jgi:hypothetical protein